ncbi:hypothetical protein [Nannocystis punicea]|uniref:Uncharacterized protein n=1 Tax=Nannocystis punicea TaxID=2995304 RepID=A0ABY7GU93_9BACT|nr:hypothetical protein [Nannocystis poenicansa]WAS90414.1 hypothetical protein O0S08_29855 [Nannocystis poenicansa]
MLRTLAVIALSSAALSAVACKKDSSKSPGGCESGYVLSEGNVCVLQNIVDYNQCVTNAAARESINVGLTKEILGRLQLQWVGPNIGQSPEARGRAAKFIELNPGSCRELEVVWGCYGVANKVQEAATEPPICTPSTGSAAPAAAGAAPAAGSTPPAESAPAPAPAPK